MNFKTKAVAAAVLSVAMVGTANASIKGTGGQGSEMFLSILRDTSAPASIVLDTGIEMGLLIANPTQFNGWTIGNGASYNVNDGGAISSFLATAPTSAFFFNGGASNTVSSLTGIVATVGSLGSFPQGASGLGTAASNIKTHITNLNNNFANGSVASEEIMYTDAADGLGIESTDSGHHDNLSWGSQVGGSFGTGSTTEAAMNTALATYYFYLSDAASGYQTLYRKLGDWKIDATAGTATFRTMTSEVPVPAAVWLLGSALVGMVGIARRRRALDEV